LNNHITLDVFGSSVETDLLNQYLAISSNKRIKIKGLAGSSGALICALAMLKRPGIFLVILQDREEALYFKNDLDLIIPEFPAYHFPLSYKKPYFFEEIENANVLQRAEVLSSINSRKEDKGLFILTYPEAISEKVINKRSLIKNTFLVRVADKLDMDFLSELLVSYDFERTDFVFEAGQFAIRGGILDIFSFAHENPIRIEFIGDEIESIREFDAETQLSIKSVSEMPIIPNVQTKLLQEERQSFLEYLPENSTIWLKDYREIIDILDKSMDKCQESFQSILKSSGNTQVINSPGQLLIDSKTFILNLEKHKIIEFGKRYFLKSEQEIVFAFKPQPTFHRNFHLLAENLMALQHDGYQHTIFAENQRQIDRLNTIFEEINPTIQFGGIIGGLHEGFIDESSHTTWYTDHQIFDRFHQAKAKNQFSKKKALTLKELKTLQTGDFVVHIDHGVARFAGLDTVDINGNKQEVMRLVYRDDDLLYVNIHALHKISRYSGKEGTPPAVNKLGSQDWENKKKRVKKQVKDIAKDLIQLYAKRKAAPGNAFPKDNFLQAELESSFMYEDTPDQSTATADVKHDMEQPHPMDRLVCGDVGFGKTEIAIRAAFKAVNAGKQVAVLVPTTILAMQHYHTFTKRLESFAVSVEYINRFKSAKDITRTKKEVKEGKVDILIGTHRIVNQDIVFKDLGLMVIDEEQKFGVKIKERLKEMRVNIDALTLTATPIPRTLHFSLMGARDLSIISTPPPNRRPVTTEIHAYGEEVIRDAVSHELRRGGQVFFVHNRVSDIENIANVIQKLVPDAKIGIAHGQMEGSKLEKVMMKFIEAEFDVLVSTNIIESGLDIPNANTIIINRAHMFGLSDLHQMRGRVGRSNTKAYCYLLSPTTTTLSADARKRLITLEEFSDLGDGFKVAMRDLDIRGAGNLLGSEQSGFINDMGFDMYHKILDEAVSELKDEEFRELFASDLLSQENLSKLLQDCSIETDLELLIPASYVSNTSERLQLYTSLDNIENETDLDVFSKNLEDRFGSLPVEVQELIKSVELRWKGQRLGFEKIQIKNNTMKGFISEEKPESYFQSTTFGSLLDFVKSHSKNCSMREYKKKLIITITEINSVLSAIEVLTSVETLKDKLAV